jgi:hypothetical protein
MVTSVLEGIILLTQKVEISLPHIRSIKILKGVITRLESTLETPSVNMLQDTVTGVYICIPSVNMLQDCNHWSAYLSVI